MKNYIFFFYKTYSYNIKNDLEISGSIKLSRDDILELLLEHIQSP